MFTWSASEVTVHAASGRLWIRPNAGPIASSKAAASHGIPPASHAGSLAEKSLPTKAAGSEPAGSERADRQPQPAGGSHDLFVGHHLGDRGISPQRLERIRPQPDHRRQTARHGLEHVLLNREAAVNELGRRLQSEPASSWTAPSRKRSGKDVAGLSGWSCKRCPEPWGKSSTSPALSWDRASVSSHISKHGPPKTT